MNYRARLLIVVAAVFALAYGVRAQTQGTQLRLSSPAPGAVFEAGQTITVTLTGEGPLDVESVAIASDLFAQLPAYPSETVSSGLPFSTQIQLPANTRPGPYKISGMARRTNGSVVRSASVDVLVERPAYSDSIRVMPDALFLRYRGDRTILEVYRGPSGREAQSVRQSTRLSCSAIDTDVAVVVAPCTVVAAGAGSTAVSVSMDGLTVPVPVEVELTVRGDFNRDREIDSDDLRWLRLTSGDTVVGGDDRDLNADGLIDSRDEDILRSMCTRVPCVGEVMKDSAAPRVACGAPTGAWSAADLAIACTAQDAGSGLANPADASFTLTTAVPDGTETADAATDSRQVCDVAGNCATAGPIGGSKIDRRAPALTIGAPAAAAVYRLGEAVTAAYQCVDGGSGVASCAGPVPSGSALSTTAVGAQSFAVSAVDQVGNAGQASVAYTVSYAVCPLFDQGKAARSGSTLPVKLRLCDAGGANRSAAGVALSATSVVRVASQTSGTVEDAGNANPDGGFRYDPDLAGYIFNLSTKGMAAGTYRLEFLAGGDPTSHAVSFQVR